MAPPPSLILTDSGRVFAKFVSLFIPLFITFTLFVYSANKIHQRLERDEFNARIQQSLAVQHGALEARFADLVSDLEFLSRYHVLVELLEHQQYLSPKADWEFLAFSQSKPIYSQVRLIDANGVEVMAVANANGQAHMAKPEELRNKADSYFFQEAIRLKQGEIYLSPLELSSDQGKVVVPHQPTVRLASPIFSGQGRLLGVILLNVRATEFLSDLQSRNQGMGGHILLLDSQGRYLAGISPDQEWGNSLPERAGFTLGNADAAAWKAVSTQDQGTLDSKLGTYSFVTFDLNRSLHRPGGRFPVWKVVHLIHPDDLIPEYAKLRGYLIAGFCLMTVLVALGAYFHASERHQRQVAALDLDAYKSQLENLVAQKTEELLSSQAHYRAVVETALDGIVILTDNKIQFANKPFLELSGYPVGEVLGKPKDAFFAPHRSNLLRGDAETMQISEGVLWHSSGLEIPIEFHAQRFEFQQQGAELYFIRDARFRKAQEETIRMLSRAVEQSPVSVVITDPEGKIIYINPKFEAVTGFSLAEAKGATPRILKSGHQDPMVYEVLWDNITQGKEWQGELLNRNRLGMLYWEKVSISPILDASGRIVNFLGIKEDVTAAKWQAAELKKAKEDAEASAKAKAEFLATMSHEIRTPMNGLIGMSNLLQETELTLEQQQYVKTLKISGENLLRIINDILDFSKIEAGKLHLEHQPLVLRQAIEESLDIFSMPAAEKELELFYHLEPGLPEVVLGDITRIKQILINLLGNAVKFTSHGQIKIKVEQGPPGSGLELRFCVSDTGIGIETSQLERLFKAFSQADSSTTRKYGGTGLGLTISKRLAEIMDGTMWAESRLGDGSDFYFTLNLGKSKGLLETKPLALPQRMKGMLVSANPDFAQEVVELSQGWEVETSCFASYDTAKAALQETYDFALLDQGAHAFASDQWNPQLQVRLRERLQQGGIPCVLSQFVNERSDAEARKDLAFIPLFKPLKQESLFQVLCRVLGKTPAGDVGKQLLDQHLAEKMPLRVLLAEDNAINQLLAVKILKKMGYDPAVANDGNEVLQVMERQPIDLILMDIQMPILDGVAAAKAVRERFAEDRQPVIIAMTANAMAEDREKYLNAGMDDYLPKPIQPHLLQVFLKNWGEGGRGQRAAALKQEFPVLDYDLLKSRASLGSGFMHRFVEAFREQAEKTLPQIEQALAQHNFAELQNRGHVLKGIAANTGAVELCDLGKKIQFKGEDGNEQGLEELILKLQPTLTKTLTALDAYLATLPPELG